MRYVAMGRNGRKNCLVIGMIRKPIYTATNKVLVKGPGLCITHRAKMHTMARNRY